MQTEQDQGLLIDIREFSQLSGLSVKTVRNYIKDGKIIPVRGSTKSLGRVRRPRRAYLFTPENLAQAMHLKNSSHWGAIPN